MLAILMFIGALSPIRMAGFVTLLSNRDPVIAESTAEITKASILSRDVFVLVNETRREYGLRPLEWSNELAHQAAAHSKRMASHKVLSHSTYGSGENCIQLIGYDFIKAQDFVTSWKGWMGSPLHKKNLLGNYSKTGVGLIKDGNTWWGTQVFGY